MSDIDWSKAPKGATHWDNECEMFCNEEGYWDSRGIYILSDEQLGWGTSRYARCTDAAWSGKGLPPVGAECEISQSADWLKCTILFYGSELVVFSDGDGERCWIIDNCKFRPIRTPEQIAAEARNQRIAELYNVITGPGDCWSQAARAIDAGYRKVTQ